MSSININVLNALCGAINKKSSNDENIQKSLDKNEKKYNFDLIIVNLPFLNQFIKIKNNKKNNVIKKADQIREAVTQKNIAIDCKILNLQYETKTLTLISKSWKFEESQLLSVIIWCLNVLRVENIDPRIEYDCLMSLISAMKEFNVLLLDKNNQDRNENQSIEKICRYIYDKMREQLNISELFANYSDLLITNTYGKIYPSGIIKPYLAQQTMINLYLQSLENDTPLFVRYSTETGSGKTCLTLALVKAHHIKTSDTRKNTFIYVCYNPVVREMILNQCNGLHVPACHIESNGRRSYTGELIPGVFNLNSTAINDKGIVYGSNTRSRKINGQSIIKDAWKKFDALTNNGSLAVNIRNQFEYLRNISDHSHSFSAEFPHIFICDADCGEILTNLVPDSTVFIDEPDVDDFKCAKHYSNIVELCPKRLIVTSATVEDLNDEMKKFTEFWFYNHKLNAVTSTVSSGTSGIHTTMTSNGFIYLPHMFVDISIESERQELIKTLRSSSLIKLYSPLALSKMMDEKELSKLSFHDLTYNRIREFILEFFENLDELQINKLKSQKLPWYLITKPLTEHEHYLSGQSLCINIDPFKQAKVWEDGLFDIKGNRFSLEKARKQFLEELQNYNAAMKVIEKNNTHTTKDGIKERDSAASLEHKKAELAKSEPSLVFPTEIILGSQEHRKKFASNTFNEPINRILNIDEKLFDNIDIEMLQWFMSGVGFYDSNYHKFYNDMILKAVSNHLLAMFLSTPELIRGMDHRFENVILNKEFTNSISNSGFKQVIGRVGRPGSNWALVVIDDLNAVKKFLTPSSLKEISAFKFNLTSFIQKDFSPKEIKKPIKFTIEKFRKYKPIDLESNEDDFERKQPKNDFKKKEDEEPEADNWESLVSQPKNKMFTIKNIIRKPNSEKEKDDEW